MKISIWFDYETTVDWEKVHHQIYLNIQCCFISMIEEAKHYFFCFLFDEQNNKIHENIMIWKQVFIYIEMKQYINFYSYFLLCFFFIFTFTMKMDWFNPYGKIAYRRKGKKSSPSLYSNSDYDNKEQKKI